MSVVVVDASVALAWCFPDEHVIAVPGVWSLKVANALLVGERRKRLSQAEALRFESLLDGLSIVQDDTPPTEAISRVVPLARQYGLSAYDASYLELAIRHGAPLATLMVICERHADGRT